MDLKEVKRLISLVEGANISHLSIESEGSKIEIKKELHVQDTHVQSLVVPSAPLPTSPPLDTATPPASEKAPDENLVPIKAEMVGTFYNAPNPESEPYVKVGDVIKAGQVVCIIEAMKLFNEIVAEESGTVEKICVENTDAVEFGQPLFLLRP